MRNGRKVGGGEEVRPKCEKRDRHTTPSLGSTVYSKVVRGITNGPLFLLCFAFVVSVQDKVSLIQ